MDVVSFRFRGHSVIDPDRYRNVEEVKRGRVEHDPISHFARRLLDEKIVDDAFIRDTADTVEHEVQEAIDFADHSRPPAMEDLYKYTYASPVPNTTSEAEQEMFQARLRGDGRGEGKR
jgi:pyruvate dehydrogenase E1 component alpha subunit